MLKKEEELKNLIKYFFIFLFAFSISLNADIEPNENCSQSELVGALEGATTHTVYTITGTIVSTTWDEANNKPYYDMDYYHFAPAVSGTVKVVANGSGNMYFWMSNSGCDRWNITKYFGKSTTQTFRVSANQRVDLKAMCRWGRTYTMEVEFTPDNEQPQTKPKISVSDTFMEEGDSGDKDMIFAVSLDKSYDQIVSVEVATEDISAEAGEDYESFSGRLEFAPGETEKEVKIKIFGDTKEEGDEKFAIKLSNPVNASLKNDRAEGVIKDDDSSSPVGEFDKEPNNDCDNSEVIEQLEGALNAVDFYAQGTIRVNQDGEGTEARDYYHFTVGSDGELKISLKSNLPMWFAISTTGCHIPWMDSSYWNVQRGVADKVEKSLEVKAGDRIDILALSYSNKDYEVHINFTPSGVTVKKPDLIVSKKDLKDPVNKGEEFSYLIEVENVGEAKAEGIKIRDFLPSGMSFVKADGEGFECSQDSGEIVCDYASLEAGEKISLNITVKAPLDEGEIINRVSVSSSTQESDVSNNDANETTEIKAQEPVEKSAIFPIKDSNDDAIEFEMIETSGYVYTGGGISIAKDLLANDMGILRNILGKFRIRTGLRFADINLSKEDKIKEAYIEFTAWEKDFPIDVTPTNLEIFVENSDNSPPFSKGATYDLSNRIKLPQKVQWSDVSLWNDGEKYRTPDIKSLLTAIVSRDDWKSGNAITFLIEPAQDCKEEDECYRRAYDFDTDPSKAPKLIIKYEE